ncbi:MAG: hydrogenase, partial [Desulfovibrio sp.]|nr:hydrogenase [Desulfovibrio sp.]
ASGDSSIAHSLAHAVLMERLSSVTVSEAVNQSRTIALELERLANHVGDLGAIAGDTGFLPTSSWNGRIRGDILTMTALLCGNRFGRSYVRPGSVLTIPDDALCEELEKRRQLSERDAIGSVGCMFKSNSVLERMHGIGTLSKDTAKTLGILGVAAKASGLPLDARFSSPLSYERVPFTPVTAENGDVEARALIREKEMRASFAMVHDSLAQLAKKKAQTPPPMAISSLPANTLCVSQVEGFRGEIVHLGLTNDHNGFLLYKVIDPSFHNWMGLALALRGNQISDFPLCNKSFNLSYCGYDL